MMWTTFNQYLDINLQCFHMQLCKHILLTAQVQNVSYLFMYMQIKENELLSRYPRKYKLGKIRLVYCRYAEYEVQGF